MRLQTGKKSSRYATLAADVAKVRELLVPQGHCVAVANIACGRR